MPYASTHEHIMLRSFILQHEEKLEFLCNHLHITKWENHNGKEYINHSFNTQQVLNIHSWLELCGEHLSMFTYNSTFNGIHCCSSQDISLDSWSMRKDLLCKLLPVMKKGWTTVPPTLFPGNTITVSGNTSAISWKLHHYSKWHFRKVVTPDCWGHGRKMLHWPPTGVLGATSTENIG